jgi:hypothetical protein
MLALLAVSMSKQTAELFWLFALSQHNVCASDCIWHVTLAVRFEILTAVLVKIQDFQYMMLCCCTNTSSSNISMYSCQALQIEFLALKVKTVRSCVMFGTACVCAAAQHHFCLCSSTTSHTRSLESVCQFITIQHTTQKFTLGRT